MAKTNSLVGNALDELIKNASEEMPKPLVKQIKSLEDFNIDINSITNKLVNKGTNNKS